LIDREKKVKEEVSSRGESLKEEESYDKPTTPFSEVGLLLFFFFAFLKRLRIATHVGDPKHSIQSYRHQTLLILTALSPNPHTSCGTTAKDTGCARSTSPE
jgi:hypothetical protein